tara:strand:+ start:1146 stop:2168 length:1023 start_codon:yes stop_codon:yes gene_type:complete
MSKAAELAALIGSQSALSNRNLIINGAMQVAQRATSVTSQTGNGVYHTVDRFIIEQSGATYDMSQSTTVPSGQGFSYSLKTVLDGAFTPSAAQFFIPFEQRIEGQNLQHLAYGTSAAKSVTLSFWIRSSKTGTYVVEFFNANPTQSRKYSKQYTINAANTWEHKTLTWEGDTVRSFDNNNDLEAAFFWWITAGTNFTSGTIPSGWENSTTVNRAVGVPTSLADNEEYYLTGVQLELGEQATPFEHRSFADDLARCQRYFQKGNGAASGRADGGTMGGFGAFKVEMRDNPSITAISQTGAHYSGSVSYTSPTTLGTFITSAVNGTGNNAYAQVTFSADAEL